MSVTADDERETQREKFVEYQRTGERRLRNELIEAHQGFAAHLARRFANRGEPLDDLKQVAFVGLLKAVERFDPGRDIEFLTFATATIEGELKRHFRDRAWSIRPPRRRQELHLQLGVAVGELSQKLGRAPRVPEVAAHLNATEDEVLEAMEAGGAYRPSSLDAPRADSAAASLESRVGWEDTGFELAEHRVLLERVLARLPQREQTIVRLRFFEDMGQAEIAAQVGISQMHVSRLLARTLLQLRDQLQSREP
jgi:RNA polymerase sigma-B factor